MVQLDCLCVPHDGQIPHGYFHVSTVNKDNDASVASHHNPPLIRRCWRQPAKNNPYPYLPSAPPLFVRCCTTTACSLLAHVSPGQADQRMDYATSQRGGYPAPRHTTAYHRPECSVTPKIELRDKYRRV